MVTSSRITISDAHAHPHGTPCARRETWIILLNGGNPVDTGRAQYQLSRLANGSCWPGAGVEPATANGRRESDLRTCRRDHANRAEANAAVRA